MINKWLISGDCHGDFSRFKNLSREEKNDPNLGIIILGDAGFNYFLDERDSHWKKKLNKLYKCSFYCVRGNHEARPEEIENIFLTYDSSVNGFVYIETNYPNIRYFKDGGFYDINGLHTLVIGGAYSVDKYYRLSRYPNDAKWTGWFVNEQLDEEERALISSKVQDKAFGLVLSHTCPYSWRPTDLFLGSVDQSTVDETMEKWLLEVKDKIIWGIWCFGHFHADRIERPYVEQYYKNIESLDNIVTRWKNYKETNQIDWWLGKSPNYYLGD